MIKNHQVVMIKVSDVKTDGDNPNEMTPEIEERLSRSMTTWGNTQPIVVDKKTMIIADGEHRLQEYNKKGETQIPAILVEFKNDAERRAYRQAANKIKGTHLPERDAAEYEKIIKAGLQDLLNLATGLRMGEVEKHLRKYGIVQQGADTEPEDPTTIKTTIKKGDLFKLGNHKLLCGDSTKEEEHDKIMAGEAAALTFTDPPYNVNYDQDKSPTGKPLHSKGKIMNDNMTKEEYKEFTKQYVKNIIKKTKGAIYICMSCKEWGTIMNTFEEEGGHWSSTIIWNKSSLTIGRSDYQRKFEPVLYGWPEGQKHYFTKDRTETDVWDIPKPNKNDLHPTMKPIALIEKAIINSSQEEDTITDPFGGSGSTMIAAENTNRKCYMIEISPEYCQVIINRWEKHTGKKAIKVN
jgi:DNA modification methylase